MTDDERAAAAAAVAAAADAAEHAEEAALFKSVHDAYIDVTKSTLDRSLVRVNVLTGSAAAVSTVYTGILALVYSAEANKGEKLTIDALIPAMFLALSLLLATIYAAMLKKLEVEKSDMLDTGIGGSIVTDRLITFMEWCFKGILRKAWALNSSIASLAVGVVLLPTPLLQMEGNTPLVCAAIGAGVVIAAAVATRLA